MRRLATTLTTTLTTTSLLLAAFSSAEAQPLRSLKHSPQISSKQLSPVVSPASKTSASAGLKQPVTEKATALVPSVKTPKVTVAKPGDAVVVIKLVDGLSLVQQTTKSGVAQSNKLIMSALDSLRTPKLAVKTIDKQLGHIESALDAVGGAKLAQLFGGGTQALVSQRQLVEASAQRNFAFLENFFRVEVKPEMAEDLVKDLEGQDIIEYAYVSPAAANADLPPITADFEGSQGYLESAAGSGGIDARFAWRFRGGRGRGTRVVDVEVGWNLDHEDLPRPVFTSGISLGGDDWDGDGRPDNSHGTAVLGEMVGLDDGSGVTGIASDAEFGVASVITPAVLGAVPLAIFNPHEAAVAAAILEGSMALEAGDVLLIEQHSPGPRTQDLCSGVRGACQRGYVPMEFYPASFAAIQLLVARGIVVVEAAGNGGQDLDDGIYERRFSRSVRDSGAILVGASAPTVREPLAFSNRGGRVDVHSWGSGVMTTGYGLTRANGPDQNQFYTGAFGGTSSASPIVAGAALSIQGILRGRGEAPLDSAMMRCVLASSGSPQTGGTGNIGPQPDLRQAISFLDQWIEDCRVQLVEEECQRGWFPTCATEALCGGAEQAASSCLAACDSTESTCSNTCGSTAATCGRGCQLAERSCGFGCTEAEQVCDAGCEVAETGCDSVCEATTETCNTALDAASFTCESGCDAAGFACDATCAAAEGTCEAACGAAGSVCSAGRSTCQIACLACVGPFCDRDACEDACDAGFDQCVAPCTDVCEGAATTCSNTCDDVQGSCLLGCEEAVEVGAAVCEQEQALCTQGCSGAVTTCTQGCSTAGSSCQTGCSATADVCGGACVAAQSGCDAACDGAGNTCNSGCNIIPECE